MSDSRRHYPGLVTRDHDGMGTLGVSFPDFDGCVTVGDTLDEAYKNACEALQFHIDGLIEDGAAIPLPGWSEMEGLAHDDEESLLIAVVAVPADVPSRAKRINITLEESLLARVDEEAARLGMPRSTLLAQAARQFIAERESSLTKTS